MAKGGNDPASLSTTEVQLQKMHEAFGTKLPKDKKIRVGKDELDGKALAARTVRFLGLRKAVDEAKQALDLAIRAREDEAEAEKAFRADVTLGLKAIYGPKSPELEDYGIRPQKTRALPSGAEKAKKAAKPETKATPKPSGDDA